MSPDPLSDTQLLAYLDGEADPETAARIEQSPHYLARARQLAELQQQLETHFQAGERPSVLELGQYHLGLLPAQEAQAVARYLAQHPHAGQQLEALVNFLKRSPLPSTASSPAQSGPLQTLKVWVAELLSQQSGAWQPAAGVRGQPEQVYQAGDVQIILDIDDELERPGYKVLAGLLLGMASGAWQVQLWDASGQFAAARVDEDGNFVLAGLPNGRYTLIISGTAAGDKAGSEIYIESLQI